MAQTYNVTIKKHNGTDWDTIYPKTTAANIISGVLDAARIPNLSADKITSGTLGTDRIPNLSADKITSGTLGTARIPNLDASKITSGIIDVARLPAIAVTNVVTSTSMSNFIPLYNVGDMQEGDVLILTTDKKTYIHNGGTAGTAADFTLMETPTDVVTSVAGKTGVVTLVKGDVGLGNVDNTADSVKNVATAAKWANARTITLGGDASGSVSIDGSSNVTLSVTVADDSHNHTIANIDNLQSSLNAKQNGIILIADGLLSGYSASNGDVAFTY
jgi:hypothetical protein